MSSEIFGNAVVFSSKGKLHLRKKLFNKQKARVNLMVLQESFNLQA